MLQKFSIPPSKIKWIILITLSLIWGSSFILIKKALFTFSPIQLGGFRVLICTLILVFMGHKYIKLVRRSDFGLYLFSGFFGNFFPVFLFAFAQVGLSSSITGILDALVPMFTLLIAILFFKYAAHLREYVGILIGFIGAILIVLYNSEEITFDWKLKVGMC